MFNDELQLATIINTFDFMTIVQLRRWFGYAEKTDINISRRLRSLALPIGDVSPSEAKRRFLQQLLIPSYTAVRGGATAVYMTGPRARLKLKQEGLGNLIKRTEYNRPTMAKDNWHDLYVNDVFITAYRWLKTVNHVEIPAMQTNFDIKRNKLFPFQSYIPDGLLAVKFLDRKDEDVQYLLELETGSHYPAAFKEKIKNAVTFAEHHGMEKTLQTEFFSGWLVFATNKYGRYASPDDHRKVLLVAIDQQLREMGKEHYRQVFRVTACDIEDTALFTDAVWFYPDNYTPYRLFD